MCVKMPCSCIPLVVLVLATLITLGCASSVSSCTTYFLTACDATDHYCYDGYGTTQESHEDGDVEMYFNRALLIVINFLKVSCVHNESRNFKLWY